MAKDSVRGLHVCLPYVYCNFLPSDINNIINNKYIIYNFVRSSDSYDILYFESPLGAWAHIHKDSYS